MNTDYNLDTTTEAVQKVVHTMTPNFLVKNDILINKIIKKCHFSASKENPHYNIYGEKKDPDLRYTQTEVFLNHNLTLFCIHLRKRVESKIRQGQP